MSTKRELCAYFLTVFHTADAMHGDGKTWYRISFTLCKVYVFVLLGDEALFSMGYRFYI